MPSPIPRQVGWNLFARTIPFASAFPRYRGGSAPALTVSRPAQRSLTLRPARLPSRHCDLLHQRLQQSRCLHCCSDCYRVERTSSRAGIPPLWTSTFHGARGVEGWRGVLGGAYRLPTLSSVGASLAPPCFRFHTPLIEPDVRICRIRLSEKTHAIGEAIACDAACN